MFKCETCNKEYNSKRSLASHKNHHNPEYHTKSKEGALKAFSSDKAKESRNTTNREKKYNLWNSIERKCIICSKGLIYPQNKTCSDICQKEYRSKANSKPMSDETKLKISLQLSNRKYTPIKLCKICQKELEHKSKSIFCSKECSSLERKSRKANHSEDAKEKISIALKKSFQEGRHKGNEYRNRKNKSYLERSFIDFLSKKYPNINYEFNSVVKVLDSKGKYLNNYFIDFYFPKSNIGIELDGKQHELTIEYDYFRDNKIKEIQNTKIYRISYDDYFNKSKYDLIIELLENESRYIDQTLASPAYSYLYWSGPCGET